MRLLIWKPVPEVLALCNSADLTALWLHVDWMAARLAQWLSEVTGMFWSSAGQRGGAGLLRCWSLTVSPRTLTAPSRPLHTSRFFSISAPAKSPTHDELNRPLKQWALEVSPFSTVRAQLGCSISVRPLDLHAFPEADRAFITVHRADTEQEVGLDDLHVHYDDRSKELLISAEKVDSGVLIDLAAPIKSSECLSWETMMQ